MAILKFVKPAPVAAVATVRAAKSPKVAKPARQALDQATIERTSGKGFLVHLTVTATQRIGLAVGDRVEMAYDPETGDVLFRKSDTGDHVCQAHGRNPRRVKWGITKFLKAHDLLDSIEGRKLAASLFKRASWNAF